MANYPVTAANVLASANALRFVPDPPAILRGTTYVPNVPIAGAAITAGQPVYQGTDNLFYPADANAADPAYKVVGIAENNAAAGQPISIVIEDPQFTPGCTLAIGDTVIVSSAAGAICPDADKASGWFVSVLGVAWSTTKMALKIIRSDAARA